jgi:RHS repeat-associated protein
MMLPGRSYSAQTGYRYGFNGKENDNEVKGEGNEQDYGMRIYDPRVGRFLSVDPLTKSYPTLTPYQFGSNDPIESIDVDGLERMDYRLTVVDGKSKLDFISAGKKAESYGGIFGLFSSTVNIPKHYRVEYNGEHYLFASGGQNSAYANSTKPLPTSSGHLDNITHDIVYSVAELQAFQKDPASFVDSHTSVEDRVNDASRQATQEGVLQYLSNAPANLTEAYGYYSLTKGKATTSTTANRQVAGANGGKLGGRTIIVDENLSPTIATKLTAEGYNVKTFAKGTTDADILDWAKKNNGAVLTNNIKDFKNRGVMTIEVPVSMTSKSNADKVVNGVNILNRNIESHGSGVYNNNSTLNLEKDAQVVHN